MEMTNSIWGKGQLMAMSGLEGCTDYAEGLVLRTRENGVIDLKFPAAGGRIVLSNDKPQKCLLLSDAFETEHATGVVVDAYHILIEGKAAVENLPDAYASLTEGDRLLVGLRKHFNPPLIHADINDIFAKYVSYYKGLPTYGTVAPLERMALQKAYSQLKGQIYSPYDGFPHFWSTPDRWPHRKMWLWDSVFHAIGIRHYDVKLAKDILRAVLEYQHDDGLIPHMMAPDGCSNITQPPVLALGLKMVLEKEADDELMAYALPKLAAHLQWIMKNRDTDGNGLVEWNIEGDPMCRSGESGMDNSPRFDAATQLDATDFNSYLSMECEIVSEFAEHLGNKAMAAEWKAHHERINRLMRETMWCESERIFMDVDVTTHKQTGVSASSGFLPLICGAATAEQVALMVQNLLDPETFATPWRVPSISKICTALYQKDMWRGPVWLNINWLIAYGLKRYGYAAESVDLRRQTRRMELKYYEKYGTFFEFFDDRDECDPPLLLRKGCNEQEGGGYHQVFFDYGWSASLFVDFTAEP